MTVHEFLIAFRAGFHTTPAQYVIEQRLRRARWLLQATKKTVAEIAYETGFSSHAHLSTLFRTREGATPNAFRAERRSDSRLAWVAKSAENLKGALGGYLVLCLLRAMHAGHHYSLKEVVHWTRRETLVFALVSAIPTTLYVLAGWKWLTIPWPPLAVVGTAVAFMTGFKNNASYARLWEARQVWGAIVNASRTFGLLVLDSVPAPEARRSILLRHVAWLTALRFQLREPRAWENMHRTHNREFQRNYRVAEWETALGPELAPLLSPADHALVLARKSRTNCLLQLQAQDLRACAEASVSGEMRHLELMRQVAVLVDNQGKCERLKNFPYPRQFATINLYFAWLFIVLTPFSLLPEFQKFGDRFVWLTVPMSVLIAWIFHTMDKIGESSENPFEGSPNDVPITAMSRTIEIDLREMLGETELPPPVQAVNNILM